MTLTPDQLAALIGFLTPMLVALINREPWSRWVKAIVALLSSVLGGTITVLMAGQFTGANWLQDIGIVFAASQAFYHLWWKNSDITDFIEQNINFLTRWLAPLVPNPPAPVTVVTEPPLGGAPGGSSSGRHAASVED